MKLAQILVTMFEGMVMRYARYRLYTEDVEQMQWLWWQAVE